MACDWCSIKFMESMVLSAKKEDVLDFFYKHGVLKPSIACQQCGNELRIDSENMFRCYKKVSKYKQKKQKCGFYLSQRTGTFLEHCKLPMEKVFILVSVLLHLKPPRFEFVNCEFEIGSTTMTAWFSFCREVFQDFVINNSVKLGGPGTSVEIHDAKFGRIKHNRGSRMKKQWFGGYDRNSNNCFLVPVESKDADSLLGIVKEWVLPGTTIYSDCFKSYECLDHEGFIQESKDHSKQFVVLDKTDVYTHNLDQIWREVRSTVPTPGLQYFVDHLAEFYFKRRFPDRFERLHTFFITVASIYPPPY
ncbi:uncharacterized protein [Diabrotica undecimpunctata]|uniref:uncharacterized protein n=1 Tax=Diabrotica undecimpunctata TaxID=50387 RepID=UPI003B6428AD